MTPVITALTIFFSVLMPQKMWYAPSQPWTVTVQTKQDVALIATTFSGSPLQQRSPDVKAGSTVDVKSLFPGLATTGVYVLYAVPKDSPSIAAAAAVTPTVNQIPVPKDFLGVPLVIETIQEKDQDAPEVARMVPLNYAVMKTDAGTMKMIFYYDSAPHTVDSFLTLSGEGFYDGLAFHRIVPDFVIQGGDPTGTGMGGPGYHLDAEFNTRQHLEGVLSMARTGDPNEDAQEGVMPGYKYANSAGSQFFICLNYQNTAQLDRRYTAFGQVVEGLDVAMKIGKSPLADPQAGTPKVLTMIQSVRLFPVTASDDPYATAKSITSP